MKTPLLLVGVLVLAACTSSGPTSITLGAGTSVVDSGFMAEIVADFEAAYPNTEVSVVALSSAEAFAYADAGTVDVIITHEPNGLAEFLEANPEAASTVAFQSSFVVVGPAPAALARDVVSAFDHIAQQGLEFVSRDDGSGTHVREMEIWAAVPYGPQNEPWYTRTGSGMGATLQVVDQRGAWTLSELGAYLTASSTLDLYEAPLESEVMLTNPYDLSVVGDSPAAGAFADWLLSEDGARSIQRANDELFNRPVYIVP